MLVAWTEGRLRVTNHLDLSDKIRQNYVIVINLLLFHSAVKENIHLYRI